MSNSKFDRQEACDSVGVSYTQQVWPLDILQEPAFDPAPLFARPDTSERRREASGTSGRTVFIGASIRWRGQELASAQGTKLSFSLLPEGAVP